MVSPQDWIHKLEEGGGLRHVKNIAFALLVFLLIVGCNWRLFRNMTSMEAMDASQLARNISEGKGFTTDFIRPISIHMLEQHNADKPVFSTGDGTTPDPAQIKGVHPDIANAPVYPVVLAGWMKIYPAVLSTFQGLKNVMPDFIKRRLPDFNTDDTNRLWARNTQFWWHSHDFLIGILNQILFLLVILLTFRIALSLFDLNVARVSAILLLLSEVLWRFSMSGLPTMLLLLIFTGLVWCVISYEKESREPGGGPNRVMVLAIVAGALAAVGALTVYSFGWMIVPLLICIAWFGGQRRIAPCLAAAAAFAVIFSPWIVRNVSVSGTPFGTAGYAIYENSSAFPGHRLARSLDPTFEFNPVKTVARKLITNTQSVMLEDLPKLGGGWTTPFFLASLMLGIRSPAIRRLRYLIVMSLLLLIAVQALGKTQASVDSQTYNSENLLVLLLPLIIVFGVSFFFVLLEQLVFPIQQLRYGVIALFVGLLSIPMFYAFLPATSKVPIAYPPYLPPVIQESSSWMRDNELMMSDVPWAVAWYGDRQCVWLTLNSQDDFFAINDYLKPVRALYLTPNTMDGRFVSEWVRGGERSWGVFLMDVILRQQNPAGFPLRKMPAGFLPTQLFLSDFERWRMPVTNITNNAIAPQ
jgi:hypothetical protein